MPHNVSTPSRGLPTRGDARAATRWTGIIRLAAEEHTLSPTGLRSLGLATLLHAELPWGQPKPAPWSLRQAMTRLAVSWHGLSSARDTLVATGAATCATTPGHAAQLALQPGVLVHARNDEAPYVALASSVTAQLVDEHALSLSDLGWIVAIATSGSSRYESLRAASAAAAGDRAAITARLRRFAASGLAVLTRTGPAIAVELPVLDSLVIEPTARPKRAERRQAERQVVSNRPLDPRSDDAMRRVTTHFGVPPAPALRSAVARCIALGMSPRDVADRLAGMGGLDKARSPIAVLVQRVTALAADQEAANARRDASRRTVRVEPDESAPDDADEALLRAWDAWLGATITDEQLARLTTSRWPRIEARKLIAERARSGAPPGPAPPGTPPLTERLRR